jgi:hypothetical protein
VIQRIINTTVHSGIGIAPAQLVFASHADLDRGILEQAAINPTPLYHLHPLFATPLTVSEHEQEEWVVESVVDHEPHVIPRDKRHLRFCVRFRGLPDTHDRMYPWAQLASNPQLHAYLRANGLARFIPTRFR